MSPLILPEAGRSMGIRWCAEKGTGKSWTLGKRLCLGDFRKGIPVIILDPVGSTIDAFLDGCLRLPVMEQFHAAKRLQYVSMRGEFDAVAPLPVYALRDEELVTTAERVLTVWERADPALESAPVMGLNAVAETARHVGILLTALGWGITEAETLLRERDRFRPQLQELVTARPETRDAVTWLLETMPKPGSADWHRLTDSYRNKIHSLTLSRVSRAIYGARLSAIDWDTVAQEKQAVLIDFRGLPREQRKFGLLWVFNELLTWIRQRPNRSDAASIVIDELSFFLTKRRDDKDPLAEDFNELVAIQARNKGIWLTVTHQELNQLSPRMHDVLMSMGTQIIGSSSDLEGGAEVWAKRFDRFDPHWVRKRIVTGGGRWTEPQEHTTEYTITEQIRLNAQSKYLDLPPFWFWGAVAQQEGEMGASLQMFTINHRNEWTDAEKVAIVREKIATRTGYAIEDILSEIEVRVPTSERPVAGEPTSLKRRD